MNAGEIRSKFNNDCKDRFLDVSNIDDDFYYYNKPFKEDISLDNLVDLKLHKIFKLFILMESKLLNH